jgi:hypothetical protein
MAMTTGHSQISVGMDVLGADGENVGQVTEVRSGDFLLARPLGNTVAVPFGAIGDVTGQQVVLTITAEHIETIKWPQRVEATDETVDGDAGSQGAILL